MELICQHCSGAPPARKSIYSSFCFRTCDHPGISGSSRGQCVLHGTTSDRPGTLTI